MDHSVVVRFGPFAFDRARMVLKREGQPVPIGGRGAALLSALVDAQGQVVTRSELLDAVWPDQVVEERNLTVQISSLRKAMGDLPGGEDLICTVSRVGYRLMLDGLPLRSSTIAALRPTVAVLPFTNLSSDPELAFFADGVTEDLIAALSRFQTFTLVWAESFEEELGGVFEMQDRITAAVVGVAEPQITRAELERSRRKHPENMDAYGAA